MTTVAVVSILPVTDSRFRQLRQRAIARGVRVEGIDGQYQWHTKHPHHTGSRFNTEAEAWEDVFLFLAFEKPGKLIAASVHLLTRILPAEQRLPEYPTHKQFGYLHYELRCVGEKDFRVYALKGVYIKSSTTGLQQELGDVMQLLHGQYASIEEASVALSRQVLTLNTIMVPASHVRGTEHVYVAH